MVHVTSCPIRLKLASHLCSVVSPSVPVILTYCDPVVPQVEQSFIDTVIWYSAAELKIFVAVFGPVFATKNILCVEFRSMIFITRSFQLGDLTEK